MWLADGPSANLEGSVPAFLGAGQHRLACGTLQALLLGSRPPLGTPDRWGSCSNLLRSLQHVLASRHTLLPCLQRRW